MKKQSKISSTLAIVALITFISADPVIATDVPTAAGSRTTQNNNATKPQNEGTMRGGYSILGSKFIGMKIENSEGENLGEVKDIMLDSKGRVRYVAVSYGGFMGMGDTMYAVPMEAFTFKRDKDMFYDDVKLILNVSKDQLKEDKGFDGKNWPDLEDDAYRKQLDKQYKVNRSMFNT